MSTTLTNGLKLPDKGSVDWYADMQNNYAILDGAVGTVAEHTAALSGKAPLVHTHTKSDITDFPAYGNAAGTICEGNDSRLSDARTPVAHTHGKADITDLFNSANTWTGDNTFSNTLNVQTGYTLGTLPQAESAVALFTGRTADSNFVTNINFYQNPTRGTGLRFTIRNKWDNNGYSTTGTTRNAHFELLQSTNKTAYMQWEGYVNNGLYPLADNTYDLGSSSYKWKTLNGINPGALSLPNSPGGTGTENVNYYDLSGNITVRDGSAANGFTAPCDGWIAIGTFATWLQISNDTLILATTANPGSDGFAQAFLPVRKGNAIRVVVNQTNAQFQSFKLLPCEGNV